MRGFLERAAINAPIQGTAADIIRRAMIRMPTALLNEGLKEARMLLQVHDELIFEVPEELVDRVLSLAQKVMENFHWPAINLRYELGPIIDRSNYLLSPQDRHLVDQLITNPSLEVDDEFKPITQATQLDIQVVLVGNQGRTYPRVLVEVNHTTRHELTLVGETTLKFTVSDLRRRNLITVKMLDKAADDTILENNTIVSDKSV